MKYFRQFLAILVAGCLLGTQANFAQTTPQPPQATQQSPEQLQQLVAPIALYPDSLIAQILPAATYPEQIVEAAKWMEDHSECPEANDSYVRSVTPRMAKQDASANRVMEFRRETTLPSKWILAWPRWRHPMSQFGVGYMFRWSITKNRNGRFLGSSFGPIVFTTRNPLLRFPRLPVLAGDSSTRSRHASAWNAGHSITMRSVSAVRRPGEIVQCRVGVQIAGW